MSNRKLDVAEIFDLYKALEKMRDACKDEGSDEIPSYYIKQVRVDYQKCRNKIRGYKGNTEGFNWEDETVQDNLK